MINITQKLYAVAIVCLSASSGVLPRFMICSWVGETFNDTCSYANGKYFR